MTKPEIEFTPSAETPWTVCEGLVPELTERVLARDEETGVVTRILSFAPGADTSPNGAQKHDFWEEVYILRGSIRDLRLNETFNAGDFAVRPPGMEHGPWISEEGCTTYEVRYVSR